MLQFPLMNHEHGPKMGQHPKLPLNNEKYVVLYGICVHLHDTLHFSLLLKVMIATENLRSKISHKNQRSKI